MFDLFTRSAGSILSGRLTADGIRTDLRNMATAQGRGQDSSKHGDLGFALTTLRTPGAPVRLAPPAAPEVRPDAVSIPAGLKDPD